MVPGFLQVVADVAIRLFKYTILQNRSYMKAQHSLGLLFLGHAVVIGASSAVLSNWGTWGCLDWESKQDSLRIWWNKAHNSLLNVDCFHRLLNGGACTSG